jgi:CheY-like chemotaxis protein
MTKMSILIVDDNASMRRTLRSCLSDLAAEINECVDGKEVLQAYATHLPDWVLMDIAMKETDGLTATRHLISQWPQARIVIVTSYDDEALREEAQQAGAVGYVLKENLLALRQCLQTAA